MAWQVLLLRLPEGTSTLSALARDYIAPSLGDPEDVLAGIERAVRDAPVTAEADGDRLVVLRNDDLVIEAELGGIGQVDRVLLRVLGSDAAFPLVCALARGIGASAVDCETDVVLDADSEVPDTLRQWQHRIDNLR
jgi:hypothetical protein